MRPPLSFLLSAPSILLTFPFPCSNKEPKGTLLDMEYHGRGEGIKELASGAGWGVIKGEIPMMCVHSPVSLRCLDNSTAC